MYSMLNLLHNIGDKMRKSKQLETTVTIATDKYTTFYEFYRFSL